MKTSKRILGIALAVIMIFNVFAVGVFAMPDDCVVDLIIDTDKDIYAPGDTITLKISTQVIPELDMMTIGGQYELAYPTAAVEPFSTSTEGPLDHGLVTIAPGYDDGASSVQIPAQSSGATLGSDYSTIMFGVADDGATTFSASAAPVDLFTIQMKVKADAAPGTYTIAFNQAGYEEWNGFMNDGIGFGGLYQPLHAEGVYGYSQPNLFNYGSVTFTVGAGKIIFHEKAQHKTADLTETSATLGFVGYFNKNDVGGFDLAENGTTIKNVTDAGVIIKVDGLMPETPFSVGYVYAKGNDEYNFRAIYENFNLAQYGDANITIQYYVTYDKDGVSDTQVSDAVVLTANDIINN